MLKGPTGHRFFSCLVVTENRHADLFTTQFLVTANPARFSSSPEKKNFGCRLAETIDITGV
jgi:hypothetical protein